jgi:hypothetical protein
MIGGDYMVSFTDEEVDMFGELMGSNLRIYDKTYRIVRWIDGIIYCRENL